MIHEFKKSGRMEKLLEHLEENVLAKLKKELGMTQEKTKKDVSEIVEWFNVQPHLPQMPDNDENRKYIETLIFYSKNRIEKVKKTADLYFQIKATVPKVFQNRDPTNPALLDEAKATYMCHFPKLTPKGYRIHYFGHIVPEASAYNPTECFRRASMMLDMMLRDPPVAGNVFILDLRLSSLSHWSRYNLLLLSKCAYALFNATVVRINAIHFINAPAFLTHVIMFLGTLMTEKVRQRVRVHKPGNLSQFFEDIPEDCLPEELGGTMDLTLEEINDYWYKRLLDNKTWFLQDEKMISDESKRPTALKKNDDGIFGTTGTFRTLSLD